MDNKSKILNFLGLIQRAGKLVSGSDAVNLAIKAHQAKVVILASDASENTVDKVSSLLKHDKKIKLIRNLSSNELSHALGKKRKLVAVTDLGFSQALIKKIDEGE